MSRVVLWLLHLQETILLPRNVEIHWTRKNHRCKKWQLWKTRVLRYHSSSKSLVSTCPYCRILRTPQSLSNHSLRPQSRSRSILQWKGSSQLPHHRGSCLSYCQSNKLLSTLAHMPTIRGTWSTDDETSATRVESAQRGSFSVVFPYDPRWGGVCFELSQK